jgi:hypothetical protein
VHSLCHDCGCLVVVTVLRKICGTHSNDYEVCSLLEHVTVVSGKISTSVLRDVLPSKAIILLLMAYLVTQCYMLWERIIES